MSNPIIDALEKEQLKSNLPEFSPGDTVVVNVKVKEGDRERVQAYEGVVIAIRNRGLNSAFTVRKISHGVGVERTFPYASPAVEKVEVVTSGKVRRGRLFYLRGLKGRAARLKSEALSSDEVGAADEIETKAPAAEAKAPKA